MVSTIVLINVYAERIHYVAIQGIVLQFRIGFQEFFEHFRQLVPAITLRALRV
jgi:hypothetical protein